MVAEQDSWATFGDWPRRRRPVGKSAKLSTAAGGGLDRMARYCATGARPEEFGTIGKSLPRPYDAMRSAKLEHLDRQVKQVLP